MLDFMWLVRPANAHDPHPRKVWKRDEGGEVTSDTEVAITFWRGRLVTLGSLGDVASVLEESARQGGEIAIRGKLREGAPEVFQKKWIKDSDPNAPLPALVPADHRWIMLDLDKKRVTAPWDTEEGCLQNAAQYRSMLPSPWRDAECVFRLSSSAGIPGKTEFGCHLYFWGDRAVCDESLRVYWKGVRGVNEKQVVDTMLFQPQQPHFLAPPLFVGMRDPVCLRSGVLSGSALLLPSELCDLASMQSKKETKAMQQKKERDEALRTTTQAKAVIVQKNDAEGRKAAYAAKALESIQQETQIRARSGSRHDAVRYFATRLRSLGLAGLLDESDCVAEMRWAQDLLPEERNPAREAASIWTWACGHVTDPAKIPDFNESSTAIRSRPADPSSTVSEKPAPVAPSPAPVAPSPAPVAPSPAPVAPSPAPVAEPPKPAKAPPTPQQVFSRYEAAVMRLKKGTSLAPMFAFRVVETPAPALVPVENAEGEAFLDTEEAGKLLRDAVDAGFRLYKELASNVPLLIAQLAKVVDKLRSDLLSLREAWWRQKDSSDTPLPYRFAMRYYSELSSLLIYKGDL